MWDFWIHDGHRQSGPPSRPSLKKTFKPSLGIFQLESVAKACVELFWKFNKNRFGRFCDLFAWRCWLFSFAGFSACLHTELALLAGNRLKIHQNWKIAIFMQEDLKICRDFFCLTFKTASDMPWLRLPTDKTPAKARNIFLETSATVATIFSNLLLNSTSISKSWYQDRKYWILKIYIFDSGVVFGCHRRVWGVQKRARKVLRWSRNKIGSVLDFRNSEISWW